MAAASSGTRSSSDCVSFFRVWKRKWRDASFLWSAQMGFVCLRTVFLEPLLPCSHFDFDSTQVPFGVIRASLCCPGNVSGSHAQKIKIVGTSGAAFTPRLLSMVSLSHHHHHDGTSCMCSLPAAVLQSIVVRRAVLRALSHVPVSGTLCPEDALVSASSSLQDLPRCL